MIHTQVTLSYEIIFIAALKFGLEKKKKKDSKLNYTKNKQHSSLQEKAHHPCPIPQHQLQPKHLISL